MLSLAFGDFSGARLPRGPFSAALSLPRAPILLVSYMPLANSSLQRTRTAWRSRTQSSAIGLYKQDLCKEAPVTIRKT